MQPRYYNFTGLLISFAVIYALLPITGHYALLKWMLQIGFAAIIFFSVYAIAEKTIFFLIAVLLAIPALFSHWLSVIYNTINIQLIVAGCSIILYTYVCAVTLWYIFGKKQVTTNVIYGAICVYMLIGLIWAWAFAALELISPGSFTGILAPHHDLSNASDEINYLLQAFFYFSYITLTTVGYGNINPASVPANALASAEAIVGQLYITILIARFVGIQIYQRSLDHKI